MSEKWITEALSLVRLFLGIAVVALGSVGAWVFQNAAWPPPWRLWVGVGVMVGLAVACVGLLIWAVRMLNRLGDT